MYILEEVPTQLPGQLHLILGIGSARCIIRSRFIKLYCMLALYKVLENLDAIALDFTQKTLDMEALLSYTNIRKYTKSKQRVLWNTTCLLFIFNMSIQYKKSLIYYSATSVVLCGLLLVTK